MDRQTILLISDMRQVYLAEILTKKGHNVRCLDIRNRETALQQLEKLKRFLDKADVLILPIPVQKVPEQEIFYDILNKNLEKKTLVMGGCFSTEQRELLTGRDIHFLDFMEDTVVTEENAVATAEGTIAELVEKSPYNIDEAKVLTGKSIHNIQDMQTAAKMLTDDYQTNILLKGGHLEGDNMCDLLHTSEFIYHIYEEKKIESNNLHGTGCTLSSAIATNLAKGYPLRESIQHAKSYITQAIIAGKDLHIGHGNGPLWHFPDSVAQICTFCAVVS